MKKMMQKNINLIFQHVRYIEKEITADYQTTRGINDILERNGNIRRHSSIFIG